MRREPQIDDTEFESNEPLPRAPGGDLLHDEAGFVVVNKPAGQAMSSGDDDEPGVIEQLGIAAAGAFIYPVNTDVSGVVLATRDAATHAALDAQFADGRMTLTYLAIVRGIVMNETGFFDRAMVPPHPGHPRARIATKDGEPARTEWRLRDSFVGFALLECVPRTRIEQQIRVHLHDAMLSLAVDRVHGGAEVLMLSSFKAGYRKSRRHPERPLIRRPSLHAWGLTMQHPRTGEAMRFEAPPPKDFRATLHQLDRFGRIAK